MKQVEFTLPEGLSFEGKQPGDEVEIMCTLKLKEGNRACLVELGSVDMPGYEDKDEDDSPPAKSNFVQGVMSQMPQQPQGNGY